MVIREEKDVKQENGDKQLCRISCGPDLHLFTRPHSLLMTTPNASVYIVESCGKGKDVS